MHKSGFVKADNFGINIHVNDTVRFTYHGTLRQGRVEALWSNSNGVCVEFPPEGGKKIFKSFAFDKMTNLERLA